MTEEYKSHQFNLKVLITLVIIGLTAFVKAQEGGANEAPQDHITIDIKRINYELGEREVIAGDTLYGSVEFRYSTRFSYAIISEDDTEIIRGDLHALDGEFDNNTEQFKVIAPKMPSGVYRFYLYTCEAKDIRGIDNFRRSERFVVK